MLQSCQIYEEHNRIESFIYCKKEWKKNTLTILVCVPACGCVFNIAVKVAVFRKKRRKYERRKERTISLFFYKLAILFYVQNVLGSDADMKTLACAALFLLLLLFWIIFVQVYKLTNYHSELVR